jgi:glutathione S-transferase
VPHTMLEATGEPFEPVLVKLHKQENQAPDYKTINPRGQVPVLVDGDEVITQILAIVTYLDDKFLRCNSCRASRWPGRARSKLWPG